MNKHQILLPASTQIVLASGSPRRRELLEQIGLPFSIAPSAAEEKADPALSPFLTVQALSLLKAADVAAGQSKQALVIGADTIVVLDNQILTKPHNAAHAIEMLYQLSGRSHSVLTGLTVFRCSDGKSVSVTEETKVYFKELSTEAIESYVKTGEPLDKAGAYGIQGLGGVFIDKIEGDYYNVVGLPLARLCHILENEFDIKLIWEEQ